MTIDHPFGSPLLPTALRRVRSDDQGIVLDVDTEDHDLGLLRSIAEAVRTDDETITNLRHYAEVMNRLDEIEREGSTRHVRMEKAALEDDAADLRAEIERNMEWATLGEGQGIRVNPKDTETLAAALVKVVAEQIVAEEKPRPRRAEVLGGAA